MGNPRVPRQWWSPSRSSSMQTRNKSPFKFHLKKMCIQDTVQLYLKCELNQSTCKVAQNIAALCVSWKATVLSQSLYRRAGTLVFHFINDYMDYLWPPFFACKTFQLENWKWTGQTCNVCGCHFTQHSVFFHYTIRNKLIWLKHCQKLHKSPKKFCQ